MTLHPYYINIMLRDPVFCNSVRGFVAKISHFGPLQARPAARRSKRPVPRTVPAVCLPSPTHLRLPCRRPCLPPMPAARAAVRIAVPRTVPAARLSHPACLRLPPAAPRPPSAPPPASPPPRARFRLSACRLPHASGCPPAVPHTPPIAVRRSTPAARAAVRIAAHARRPCRRPHRLSPTPRPPCRRPVVRASLPHVPPTLPPGSPVFRSPVAVARRCSFER